MDTPRRYHPIHVTLHWLIAIGVFLNLYLGFLAFDSAGDPGSVARNIRVALHMATGILVLVLLLIRFLVRLNVPRPADVTAGNQFLDTLAKGTHYGLYLSVLAVTVLGLIFSLQTGRFQSAFLGAASQGYPRSALLEVHEWTAYLLLALVTLHILATLYHQLFRKDHLLARMWYGAR